MLWIALPKALLRSVALVPTTPMRPRLVIAHACCAAGSTMSRYGTGSLAEISLGSVLLTVPQAATTILMSFCSRKAMSCLAYLIIVSLLREP